MGIPANELPESFRRCMEPETRKQTKLFTNEEIAEKVATGQELEAHEQFRQWCNMKEIPYVYCNPTRKATIAKGHPDFTLLYGGWACCIEFKTHTGKLSEDQHNRIAELEKAGVPVKVCTSLKAAINYALETLQLNKA